MKGFFTEGPICTEEYFFGRAEETERILGLLRRDQSVSIVGPRGIGKSSLLHHISKPAVFEAHHLTRTRHRFVHIDCCDLTDLDASRVRAEIVQQAKQKIPEVEFPLPSGPAEHFRRFFWQVERAGLCCVIMLDHFEFFIESHRLDQDCLAGLRAINAMYHVFYVVASTESLSTLEGRWLSQRDQTSPFFNIFYRQNLGPFSQDESHAFLQQRFESARLSVPSPAVDLVLRWSQGHPYYLQSAGAFIVNLLNDRQGEWNEHLMQQLQDYLANFPQAERHLRKESL